MEAGTQVVVYGPDGTSYGNSMIAERAGVTNYTMTPPAQPTVQPPTSPTPSTGNENMAEEDNTTIEAPTTGAKLIERLGEQATGSDQTIPELGTLSTTPQEVQTDELMDTPGTLDTVSVPTASAPTSNLNVPSSTKAVTDTYTANLTGNTPVAVASEGKLSTESLIGDVQGAVSADSQAVAQTEELDPKATVQYQLGELYSSLEEGKPCLLYTSPSPRDRTRSRMPSSA